MGRTRVFLRQSKLVSWIYYGLHLDDLSYKLGFHDAEIKKAMRKYIPQLESMGESEVRLKRKEIIDSYCRYKSLPSEYFLFRFGEIAPVVRATYVTDAYINSRLSFKVGRRKHDLQLNNKYNFYCLMKPYFGRQVVKIEETDDFDAFRNMALSAGELIIKPKSASVGSGIIFSKIRTEDEARRLFDGLLKKSKDGWVAEEVIRQTAEMASWNATSVNSVRLSTFLTKHGFFVLSSILRTGRLGSIVDNAGRGGISAAINPGTGEVLSDCMDKNCNWYKAHPDSKKVFKGYFIPEWDNLLSVAETIHRTIPEQVYVGWDFALTDNGWVLIEGNWGELGAQQVALGRGLKPDFDRYLKDC